MPHACKLLTIAAFFGLTLSAAGSSPREQVLDSYQNGLAPGWETKSFAGQTHYTAEHDDKQFYIKATSNAAASGLFRKITYDSREQPILRWSWKIERTLSKGDERAKAGDDYAARVYVVFPSIFFWNTKALNYIWANTLPKGEALPNIFTANAMMIAVESGNGRAGQWMNEERNIYEDFKKYFKTEPPRVGAIAIMTDTDNTGETATAWYGPIIIAKDSPQP
ncbi:MAG: DUF3047 domain-containing protein [Desulfobulbaceae bacterium]|nr:DUF3047 domain-containing protein [Desulfobulbaceae bacterium]HIJ91358.1 DUF3047 domain-containing protein [Deltaproteobacteria bacterium]